MGKASRLRGQRKQREMQQRVAAQARSEALAEEGYPMEAIEKAVGSEATLEFAGERLACRVANITVGDGSAVWVQVLLDRPAPPE